MLKIKNWILILIVAYSSFALACSCMRYTQEEAVAANDAIILVDVYMIEVLEKGGAEESNIRSASKEGLRRGHFKVVKTLKGIYHGPSYIETVDHAVCCLCHSVVKKGRYLLYSKTGESVNISSCSPDQIIRKGDEHLIEAVEKLASLSSKEMLRGYITYDEEALYFATTDSIPVKIKNIPYSIIKNKVGYYSFEGVKLSNGSILLSKIFSEENYPPEVRSILLKKLKERPRSIDNKEKINTR
ncbi:hypothetical protein [Pleionea sp. CnH1-48]|uniref:hypothetical protein n=1 Tax=Pleionea sp. CnH1-48 TaxID=2954494 RepID=UPI00209843B0|nr:hypothetical protein [Pleionea sp. CnH1-48]MCO7223755.1 hypothetical protein [Pleionea sp. CnH1-48]